MSARRGSRKVREPDPARDQEDYASLADEMNDGSPTDLGLDDFEPEFLLRAKVGAGAPGARRYPADLVTRTYDAHGYAGCVSRSRSRQSGRLVGVYQGAQAGIEDDPAIPWVTVCEDHGSCVCHSTLALARAFAAYPLEWCEDCRTEAEGKGGLQEASGQRTVEP